MLRNVIFAALLASVTGHGHLTLPNSRNGGTTGKAGLCTEGECYWFSNNVEIPHEPTLPQYARSYSVNITGGVADTYKTSPWRSPGYAPVFGSGCGVQGGADDWYLNGGFCVKGEFCKLSQGGDGVRLPAVGTTTWKRGATVEVAWAISANHGGGYQYRLCKNDGEVNEECFQKTPMKFAGDKQWLLYNDGRRVQFEKPLVKVTEGVYPEGSEWARAPVPACYTCDAYQKCGSPIPPVAGLMGKEWDEQVNCYASYGQSATAKATGSCSGETQFPEASPGISGFGKYSWQWSILDEVVVPDNIEPGNYLLSWRWDCEESTQVWQNCADIVIEDENIAVS